MSQQWIDWAIDRWLDLDPTSPEARALIDEIFREQARQLFRRDPRKLRTRDAIKRSDPQEIRNRMWLRARKQLRHMQLSRVANNVLSSHIVATPIGRTKDLFAEAA